MAEHPNVMISSTARDLPEHRKVALDGCMRQSFNPLMMEHLPARDADAIRVSLEMVDKAEIYLGIFAYRYGFVPKESNPEQISITEMEFNRAVERKIPCLIFIMDKSHSITAADMDEDTKESVEVARRKVKLEELKARASDGRGVNFFKSPADLRADIINSLSHYRTSDVTQFHYVSDIPEPPEAYIAHPYTLLQTGPLVGRQQELNLLTDWVTKPNSEIYQAQILNVVAIGGMGKSALTWKWFNEIAPQEMKPLAGQMWWSFYESDASFENFVTRALAYVSKTPREEIEKLRPPEREEQLLAILNREPYLLVLDGLERILIAYARMDAARLADDDLDELTANIVAAINGLPESAAQSFIGQHRLRKTADPRMGNFLRKLANVKATRILVSTRLYPADLQTVTGDPFPGSFALFVGGLSNDDALNLWREFKVSGSRKTLLPVFNSFGNYPLLIQALAGEVANSRRAARDFDKWRVANPTFNPFKLDLKQAKSHVLQFALQGLNKQARKVLHTIAAFRGPTNFDTLVAVLVQGKGIKVDNLAEKDEPSDDREQPFQSEQELDHVLTELEDRGLIGWDRRANRYDLHPIVRGVTWSALDENTRHDIYASLQSHFEAVPQISDWQQVNSLEDLTPAIELYSTLIGLGRYDDAYIVFRDRISLATLWRLSAGRQRVELLEMLFPDGLDHLPRLSNIGGQGYTLNALALGYKLSGRPGGAVSLYRRHNDVREKEDEQKGLSVGLCNLSDAQRLSGVFQDAKATACHALLIARERDDRFQEGVSLYEIGLAAAMRGAEEESKIALHRSLKIWIEQEHIQFEGLVSAFLAQREMWINNPQQARSLADRAWELAHKERFERDFIRAARLLGEAALGLGDMPMTGERLHHALTRARAVNDAEDELPALVALAEMYRQQGNPDEARARLDEVWEGAERGPYPLFHADALNVLAQIERDAGNHEVAVKAATEAYTKAWCDGISADGSQCYAYWWGLKKAREHLQALGAPEPVLPPFDPANFEPMPEVEINPDDEFHVDEDSLDLE